MRDGHEGVRLMNDYAAGWPLWWTEGLQAEPQLLRLSADLEARLRMWARHFDDHFDPYTRWDSEASERLHAAIADELILRLKDEIDADLAVHPDLWELQK